MKEINLLLEDDEILFMRLQARILPIMIPETTEQVDSYVKKVLDATSDISQDSRKEIGKIQRAMRRVKKMPQYGEFMDRYKVIENLLIKYIERE